MAFRARKSFKLMPGVRVTVSKSGLSTSVGTTGARVTASTSGRVTRTIGIPGTGMYDTESLGSGRSRSSRSGGAAAQPAAAPAAPPEKPGLFAPRWEKDLYKAITTHDTKSLPTIAAQSPEAAPVASVVEGMWAFTEGNNARARELLAWAWAHGGDIENDPFIQKYVRAVVTINVAQGVSAQLPLSRDAVGLALAELHQDAGDPDAAIAVVEAMDPSVIAAVSLAELYIQTRRFDEVVSITNGVKNEDDATALLATYRGTALRELGHFEASRQAFKDALRSTKRDESIRHLALFERSRTYAAEGKKSLARKDLERILAADAEYPGLQEALQRFSS